MIATLIICHARNLHLVVLVFFGMVKTAYCDDKENIVDKTPHIIIVFNEFYNTEHVR